MSSATAIIQAGPTEALDAAQQPVFIRRLIRRPLAVASIAFLLFIIGVAAAAPLVLPHVAHEGVGDLLHPRQGPSAKHLLGTDSVGRDVLNRLLVGASLTMIGVAEALIVGVCLGVPLGLAAGFIGGRLDRLVGWLIDLALSVPNLIVILVVIAIFPHSVLAAMVTLGVLSAPSLARVVRAVTLPVREELYIAAARVSGLTRRYIIIHHLLPRIVGTVIVQTSLFAAGAVGLTAGLAFLGVLDTSVPTWGGMTQDGISVLQLQPWLIWPPGIAIGLTVLAFTLLGDAVRDVTAESWSPPVRARRPSRLRRAPRPHERTSPTPALLAIEDLTVTFPTPGGRSVAVVEDLSFHVNAGEVVGVVGESGSGKTVTALAILGLLPASGRIESGTISYHGSELSTLSERGLRQIRGRKIALISQEPIASLNPTFRVGWQIVEGIRRHQGLSRSAAREFMLELLRSVKLPEPELIARRYVHELSGGMAQRVAIARALAGDPKLLIADEPTTALDVTVQAEILDLLRELSADRQMAILLISHDWGVVADLCERAVVMYAGQKVEEADVSAIFRHPLHPYTEALLRSDPHHAPDGKRLPSIGGTVPKPGSWPQGCHFHPRCNYATPACQEDHIPVAEPSAGRQTRCIHYDQLARR